MTVKRYWLDKQGIENLYFEPRDIQDMNAPVGHDASASNSTLETDVVRISQNIVQTFAHQKTLADKMPCLREMAAFDGIKEFKMPTIGDIDAPLYTMTAGTHNVKITGTTKSFNLPQLNFSARAFTEEWQRTFGGKARVPMQLRLMREKIDETRDIVELNGKTFGSNTLGLVGGAYSSLSATGIHDVQTNTDGILTNAVADQKQFLNYFTSKGYYKPIKEAITNYLYNLYKVTLTKYQPVMNNVEMILKMLPMGSEIFDPSDNLQCTVSESTYTTSASAASQTILAMLDMGSDVMQGAVIVESGVQQVAKEMDLWEYAYGMRQIAAAYVIDTEKVAKIVSIDTAT